jgi:hypothetical protein
LSKAIGEAAPDLLQLLRLAAVEGDGLGVFAHPHQAKRKSASRRSWRN